MSTCMYTQQARIYTEVAITKYSVVCFVCATASGCVTKLLFFNVGMAIVSI